MSYDKPKPPNVEGNKPVKPARGTKVTVCPPFVPRYQIGGAIQFGLQRGRVTR